MITSQNIDFTYNVRDFGASGDGLRLDTAALQSALDACGEAGGGTVILPPGIYLSGALFMHSHTTLRVEEGATLQGSAELDHYPLIDTRWEGTEQQAHAALLNAWDATDLTLTGRGTISGSGTGNSRPPAGPRVVGFIRCRKLLFEDLTFLNKGRWTIHTIYSQDIIARNLNIQTDGHNTDGFNPDSCRNVHISHCRLNTGDDCIAIKSGKNLQALEIGIPCENITVENCVMTGGHGGVVIGSEMSGGVRDLTVRNCRFQTMWKGVRIKTRAGRGGFVENVLYENISIDQVAEPIDLDMTYNCNPGELIDGEAGIPVFREISLRNITITGSPNPGQIHGLPESPIQNLVLKDITLDSGQPLPITRVVGAVFENIRNTNLDEALTLEDVTFAE